MEKFRQAGQWVLSEDGGHRLRMRAPSELAFRESGLLELVKVLEELKIPYFLADGTLLPDPLLLLSSLGAGRPTSCP